MRIAVIFVISFLLVSTQTANALQLVGLFGEKSALLLVDGKQKVLKLGETYSGVTLINIANKVAVVDVDGKQQSLSLTRQVAKGGYKKPKINTVRIASKSGGHYWVAGLINGFSVDFVVDTGATTLSMNASTAKRLGIDYSNGQLAQLSTANGLSEARVIRLDKVSVGEITKYNVLTTVTLSDALPVVLLGNSFLSGVNMRTEDGVLILESRL